VSSGVLDQDCRESYVVALLPDGATYVLLPGLIGDVNSRQARPSETILLNGVGFAAVTPSIPAGQIVTQRITFRCLCRSCLGRHRPVVLFRLGTRLRGIASIQRRRSGGCPTAIWYP